MSSNDHDDQEYNTGAGPSTSTCHDFDDLLQLALQDMHPQLINQFPVPPLTMDQKLDIITQQNSIIINNQTNIINELAEIRKIIKPSKPVPIYFCQLDNEAVSIGTADVNAHMTRSNYLRAYEASRNGRELVLKLLTEFYSREELSTFSFNGDQHKKALRREYLFKVIMAQAELQFPGFLETEGGKKQVRDAVNGKCRKASHNLKV